MTGSAGRCKWGAHSLEKALAALGSVVKGLCPDGRYTFPTHWSPKPQGGIFTYVEDNGPRSLGPVGFEEDDLEAVFGRAKLCILLSREPNYTEARVIETLLLAHTEPRTVLIHTEPQHHVQWARWVRMMSGRGPVMLVLETGVDMLELGAPADPAMALGTDHAHGAMPFVHDAARGLH
jgi:hypothetical protein